MERWELLSSARKKYREKIGESARTLRGRHSAPPGRCPCLLAFLLDEGDTHQSSSSAKCSLPASLSMSPESGTPTLEANGLAHLTSG
jgi:hypothetical protein